MMSDEEYMIEVIQAFADGKDIEYIVRSNPDSDWIEADVPCWDWSSYDYRVKPEPMVCYLVVKQDVRPNLMLFLHRDRQSAVQAMNKTSGDLRIIKMIETDEE